MSQHPPDAEPPVGPDPSDRNWAMLVHVGTLATLLTGGWFVNIVVPLVGYLWKRESSNFVAEHAREELNFQISLTIYVAIAFVLAVLTLGLGLLVIIPIGLVAALVVLYVMIRAAIAASNGEAYRYPLTLRLVS